MSNLSYLVEEHDGKDGLIQASSFPVMNDNEKSVNRSVQAHIIHQDYRIIYII